MAHLYMTYSLICTRPDMSACDDVFDNVVSAYDMIDKLYPHMMYLYMMNHPIILINDQK